MPVNGHNTYLPAPYDRVDLNDCYPIRDLSSDGYIYHPQTDRRIDLGHFPSPVAYRNDGAAIPIRGRVAVDDG